MGRILITGSSEGLGYLAGKKLVHQGHEVIFHARNQARFEAIRQSIPKAHAIVIGDVSTLSEMKSVAEQVNTIGNLTAIIHNVGVYQVPDRSPTVDGVTKLFAVNVLAPYVLSALIPRPERVIFMSSGMHRGGHPDLDDPQSKNRPWNSTQSYSDSKLYDLILAKALARIWPQSFVNAVDPGWVPTRMGGPGAPDNLDEGAETQVWLAASPDPEALVSGFYFHHKKKTRSHPAADQVDVQNALLRYLAELSGVEIRG